MVYGDMSLIQAGQGEAPRPGKKMAKIEEFSDAEDDDDCCEIDPAEFAKKVNLKASDDDVVIVAAKGQIRVKVEVDESVVHVATGFSGFFKSEPGYLGSTSGNRHGCACGNSKDNPYEIDEDDETTVRKAEDTEEEKHVVENKAGVLDLLTDDKPIPDKPPVKMEPPEEIIPDNLPVSFEEFVVPDMSPPVKFQPEDCSGGGGKGVEEEDAYDRLPEEIIPDKLPVSLEELVIPDMSLPPPPPPPPVKCEPEDCSGGGKGGEEEHAYDHLPELNPGGRVFDEEDDDDVVVVGRADAL